MAAEPLTRESVQAMLIANPRALERAIVAIYRRQMADEQHARATLHDNGIGFNSADAGPLSIRARHLLSGAALSDADMADARARMLKYWKQLIDIAVDRQLKVMIGP